MAMIELICWFVYDTHLVIHDFPIVDPIQTKHIDLGGSKHPFMLDAPCVVNVLSVYSTYLLSYVSISLGVINGISPPKYSE